MQSKLFNKSLTSMRLILKNDRLQILIWIFSISILSSTVAKSYDGLFSTHEEMLGMIEL